MIWRRSSIRNRIRRAVRIAHSSTGNGRSGWLVSELERPIDKVMLELARVITLGAQTGLPVEDLGGMVGRQTPFLALMVPLILIGMVDGARGIRQAWPVAAIVAAHAMQTTAPSRDTRAAVRQSPIGA